MIEKSPGMVVYRAKRFQRALADVGFFSTSVLPFEIPIELPEINGTDADLRTYTVDDPLTGHSCNIAALSISPGRTSSRGGRIERVRYPASDPGRPSDNVRTGAWWVHGSVETDRYPPF
jgi:hypothetical protein